jgi:hypothetical protein
MPQLPPELRVEIRKVSELVYVEPQWMLERSARHHRETRHFSPRNKAIIAGEPAFGIRCQIASNTKLAIRNTSLVRTYD